MFYLAENFNQNIGDWKTQNVTDFSLMFYGNLLFNQDIGLWNTSEATTMQGMFNGAASFNQDISSWCVEKITEEPSQFSFNSPLLQSYKPIWGSCGPTETGINPNIYLDTNGVTIKCEDAALGEKGLVNGKNTL